MMTKSNEVLQQNVIDELAFEPAVEAARIGVTVERGVVTLRGSVGSFAEKLAAEQATRRVSGVHAFTDELKVDIASLHQRNDTDIAAAAVDVLRWDVTLPVNAIQVQVSEGWLTLSGQLEWQFQVDNARRSVQHIMGVRGITNTITLKTRVAVNDVKLLLEKTFKRSAEIDADKILIDVKDGAVTLRGTVHSWNEYDDATRAAFSLAGVRRVENLTHV